MRAALAAVIISLAAPVVAGDFVLDLPIDCTLGDTCYIQQFVDREPGPNVQDFACGGLSYDGHGGTDFALPTHAARKAGVDVLAAADGVVTGIRNDMPDTGYSEETADTIAGRDCGNGVVLQHPDGWETQYCHMALGSITVTPGDLIAAGDPLGQVGFSGRTQFPHLHLTVRKDGVAVDPFAADTGTDCVPGPSLWRDTPTYQPGALLEIGFSDQIPDYDAIKAGEAARADLSVMAPALVVFGFAFGGRAGDVIKMEISGPNGTILDQSAALERPQAQFFRAAGKRLRAAHWPAGAYTGRVALMRNGAEIDSRGVTITLN